MSEENPLWVCYNTAFEWGKNDCCLMAANYVVATKGIDCAEPFRGKYNTAIGAYRLLSKAGGMEAILVRNGFKKLEYVGLARTGDVALFYKERSSWTMGIVNGSKAIFAGGATKPLSELSTIYRLCHSLPSQL